MATGLNQNAIALGVLGEKREAIVRIIRNDTIAWGHNRKEMKDILPEFSGLTAIKTTKLMNHVMFEPEHVYLWQEGRAFLSEDGVLCKYLPFDKRTAIPATIKDIRKYMNKIIEAAPMALIRLIARQI